jgi:hypothetical protein
MNEIELSHHKNLVSQIYELGDIANGMNWTEEQENELGVMKIIWRLTGARIHYLQMLQLGYRLKDISDTLSPPDLKIRIRVAGNYFFALLQVINQGFDILCYTAEKQQKPFPFNNPREVLSEICREQAQFKAREITSHNINVGISISQLRKEHSQLGKFYRLTLSESEGEIVCKSLERTGMVGGFVLVSIYREVQPKYLKKWNSWKLLYESHKSYHQYLKNKRVQTIKWNSGHPVWSKTGKPVLYSSYET